MSIVPQYFTPAHAYSSESTRAERFSARNVERPAQPRKTKRVVVASAAPAVIAAVTGESISIEIYTSQLPRWDAKVEMKEELGPSPLGTTVISYGYISELMLWQPTWNISVAGVVKKINHVTVLGWRISNRKILSFVDNNCTNFSFIFHVKSRKLVLGQFFNNSSAIFVSIRSLAQINTIPSKVGSELTFEYMDVREKPQEGLLMLNWTLGGLLFRAAVCAPGFSLLRLCIRSCLYDCGEKLRNRYRDSVPSSSSFSSPIQRTGAVHEGETWIKTHTNTRFQRDRYTLQ